MCVMVKSCQVRRLKTLQRRYKSLPLDASGNPTTRGMPYLSGNVSLMRRGMETMEELDHFKFHLKLYLLFQCGFLTMTRLIWLHKLHSMIVTQHAVKKPEGDRMPSNAKFRSVGLMIIVVCPIRSFVQKNLRRRRIFLLTRKFVQPFWDPERDRMLWSWTNLCTFLSMPNCLWTMWNWNFLPKMSAKYFSNKREMPLVGVLTISYVAVTPGEIANEFADFWRHPYPLKNEIWGGEPHWNFILKFNFCMYFSQWSTFLVIPYHCSTCVGVAFL